MFATWQQRSQHSGSWISPPLAAYGIDPAGAAHSNLTVEADPEQGGVTVRRLDEQQAIHLLRDLDAIA